MCLISLSPNFLSRVRIIAFRPRVLTGKPTPNMQYRESRSCFSLHPLLHLVCPGTSYYTGSPQPKPCPRMPPHCKLLYLSQEGIPLGQRAAQSPLRRTDLEKRPMQALETDSQILEQGNPGSQLPKVGAGSGRAGRRAPRTPQPMGRGKAKRQQDPEEPPCQVLRVGRL